MSDTAGYVALGLVCFLAVSVSTHLFLKSREERRAKESKDSELNQKIESLLKIIDEYKKSETELLIKHEGDRQKLQLLEAEKQKQLDQVEEENQELKRLQEENQEFQIKAEGDKQRLQQLELELQRQLSELSSYKEKADSLDKQNKELQIKSERDNERLQALENTNQDLRTRSENYQNKLQELEAKNNNLSVEIAEKKQKTQQLEEERANQIATEQSNKQKIEELEKTNKQLSIETKSDKQRLQQLESEIQGQLSELSNYKQKQESLEGEKQDLLIKSKKDDQKLQFLEQTNQELTTRSDNYQLKLQELEAKNNNLSVEIAEKKQKTQQLEEEKEKQIMEEENLKKKIEELEQTNQNLLIESEGAKKLQEVSIHSSKFYEDFLGKGLDTDLTNLVKYQEFYREHSQLIEDWKQQADLEKNRVRAGKIYEGNWGERILELFGSEELDYIELEEQPSSSQGGKADFKLVFRNSRNKQSSTNSIRIMIELKYSFGEVSLSQQFSTTKSDLRKALEVAKYSSEPYSFIFLVTNREFEIEEYKKSETIWIVSDRDYKKFGLGSGRAEGEPILAIMTPEASFRWARMLYLIFWLTPTNKKVDGIIPQEESIEKLDQRIADFIKDCHSMTAEAEGVSYTILKLVEQFFEDLEKKFKQAKNKLLKSEKALHNVKEKNSSLWRDYKSLSLSFSGNEPEEITDFEIVEEEEG